MTRRKRRTTTKTTTRTTARASNKGREGRGGPQSEKEGRPADEPSKRARVSGHGAMSARMTEAKPKPVRNRTKSKKKYND